MQPRPRGPGLAQPAQPQQRDDERVLDRVGRVGAVAEQPDSGRVQRRPAPLEQARQGLDVARAGQRAQLRVGDRDRFHVRQMHGPGAKFANFAPARRMLTGDAHRGRRR